MSVEEGFNKERLCSLVRLLSTPVDGERLGAVRGIDRILKAAGLSFHDLASAIKQSPLVVDEESVDDALSWLKAAEAMLDSGGLSEREAKFVADMCSRFTRPGFEPTKKQSSWFVAIYRRVVQKAA